jgi:hypothetical protein
LASEETTKTQEHFVQETLNELDTYINDIVTKQVSDAQAI